MNDPVFWMAQIDAERKVAQLFDLGSPENMAHQRRADVLEKWFKAMPVIAGSYPDMRLEVFDDGASLGMVKFSVQNDGLNSDSQCVVKECWIN